MRGFFLFDEKVEMSKISRMNHTINVHPDGEGYIAEVEGYPYMYAFGYSEEEARRELYDVLSMLKDYYSEQANLARSIIETPAYAL